MMGSCSQATGGAGWSKQSKSIAKLPIRSVAVIAPTSPRFALRRWRNRKARKPKKAARNAKAEQSRRGYYDENGTRQFTRTSFRGIINELELLWDEHPEAKRIEIQPKAVKS